MGLGVGEGSINKPFLGVKHRPNNDTTKGQPCIGKDDEEG